MGEGFSRLHSRIAVAKSEGKVNEIVQSVVFHTVDLYGDG